MEAKRFIWEEVSEDPDIYRISEAGGGNNPNGYLILSDGEALAVDIRSFRMMRTAVKLAVGLGAGRDKIEHFMTHRCILREEEQREYMNMPFRSIFCGENAEETEQGSRWTPIADGDKIRVGEHFFTCVSMPGTAAGATGLWFPLKRLLLAGNAVSFEQLPKTGNRDEDVDTLGLQFETIRRIRSLRPDRILTGAGRNAMTPQECSEMTEQMLADYCLLLLKYYQIVCDHPGLTAKELNREMSERRIDREKCSIPEGLSDSCRKYLLYRKYIAEAESKKGTVYERGSTRLTEWKITI